MAGSRIRVVNQPQRPGVVDMARVLVPYTNLGAVVDQGLRTLMNLGASSMMMGGAVTGPAGSTMTHMVSLPWNWATVMRPSAAELSPAVPNFHLKCSPSGEVPLDVKKK